MAKKATKKKAPIAAPGAVLPPVSTLPAFSPLASLAPLAALGSLGFPGVAPPQPQVNLEPRTFKQVKEAVGEYKLDDGTTLVLRVVIVDVRRMKDQYGPDGKPSYVLVSTNVTETHSPRKLMKQFTPALAKKQKRKTRGRK